MYPYKILALEVCLMKKGLGGQMLQVLAIVLMLLAVLAVIWLGDNLSWVLEWLRVNWYPFTWGFGIAMILKVLAEVISERRSNRRDREH